MSVMCGTERKQRVTGKQVGPPLQGFCFVNDVTQGFALGFRIALLRSWYGRRNV